jgi:predicted AAA+ superfamily ATPase
LAELLRELPAVALEGAKAVGKTRTAERLSKTVFPFASIGVAQNAAAGPTVVRDAPPPVLIDEWQRGPWIWDEVRQWVDRDPAPGRFILTGSAAPVGTPIHSGAGRIVPLRMRPMSLAERNLAEPVIGLGDLLAGQGDSIGGATGVGLRDYVEEITASGFPGIRSLGSRARKYELDGYVEAVVTREFNDQGHPVRRPEALLAWLRAYALATASTAAYTAIVDAATPGQGDKPSKSATAAYRDTLSSLWLLDDVSAWNPVFSGLQTPLARSPKHFLADPALAARLLRLTGETLVAGSRLQPTGPQAGSLLGRMFEALVALSLKTYAQANDAELFHLRTANTGHEVDFIVERGTDIVAIEVKLAQFASEHDVRHLEWLARRLPDRHVERVVLTTGQQAFTRSDGIHVMPAVLLGP